MASVVEYNAQTKENCVTFCGIQEKKQAETKKVDSSNRSEMVKLAQRPNNRRNRIPYLFERSSGKWWNPQMDSDILEKQCQECSLEQSIAYFQLALFFIMLASLSWIIYFCSKQQPAGWIGGVVWAAGLAVICIILYIITRKHNIYKRFSCYIAIFIAVLLMVTVFLAAFFHNEVMTKLGSFLLAAEVILLLYTVMPLPLHINFALGIAFSIAYEVIYRSGSGVTTWTDILSHILLHICIHIVGVQICINLQVRRRSTFWKVGQIIQSSLSVTGEAKFKRVMIDSIMPPSISKILMEGNESNIFVTSGKSPFRPLYIDRLENVSILYADIVGFTKMSANKSAAALVFLLNDLFGRFDTLCIDSGCEKISTLGDCYYCVAGCPDPRDDHAKCCVEMGLGMISAIKEFCADNDLNVDMRIGIHTGIVICGIVGMKRFKFDVWSNDVSFANQMEQWGVPGRIHISQETKACLGDLYEYEDGRIEERAPIDVVKKKNLKTYLIINRANSESASCSDYGSSSSQDGEQGGGDADNVQVENEQALSNGVGADKAPQENKKQDDNPDGPEQKRISASGSRVGVADEAAGAEKKAVNRSSSHRHHSNRDRSRRNRPSDHEPRMQQNQILELIGLHTMLPILNPGESVVRMEQDRNFVETIQADSRMQNINNSLSLEPISMRFRDGSIEEAYRSNFRSEVKKNEPITTFVSARFSFFLDLLISIIVFLLVFLASMLSFGTSTDNVAWIIFFCIFFCLQLFVITVTGTYVFNLESVPKWIEDLIKHISGWIPRHILGAITLASPAGVVFSFMWCRPLNPPSCTYYLIIVGVVIVQFLNFNQLSSWMRSVIASLVALTATLLVYVNPCQQSVQLGNFTESVCAQVPEKYNYEFILDILLLMLFIFIVNKEYEIGHRLTYYSAHKAEESNKELELERNQFDQLLHHIIPPRVTEVMRDQNTYSQNHENIGVIFGSIVNFDEFYEEAYAGGKECIRVLNELIGDVDELLDKKEYADVEKIKTIGSTFMIAAGLNPSIKRDANDHHSHLRTLMAFCIEMQDVIYQFNINMVCFSFILRIGFNHGSVTAGVIGTTKLLYDIWGDTVNIASRMDSTGQPNKIQVSEGSMKCLVPQYTFEYRGSIYVKGKGDMQTYLLNRPNDRPVIANPARTPVMFEGQQS